MHPLSLLALVATFVSAASAQACLVNGVGLGWCQGILYCWVEVFGDSIDCQFNLYDSYCNQIASDVGPNVGDAIDSELQWTVDITELNAASVPDYISVQFAYAGGLFGAGASDHSTGTFNLGLTGGAWFRTGFICA